jgi:lipid II:glycine glycyltransferase (peptidoglycan interpeptide bridge formation enzyme)
VKPLDPGYFADPGELDKKAWHDLMLDFDDTSFYQTWSYGAISWTEGQLSHLVLRKEGQVVGAAQLRLVRIPLLKAGAAYLTWGPMWRRKNEPPDTQHLKNMMRALYNEYAIRRGYFLYVLPRTIRDNDVDIREAFLEEGFSRRPDAQQTVYVDLMPPLDEIRKSTKKRWRQTLQRAEKQNLEIVEGSQEELYAGAVVIIEEMKERKKYVEYGSMKRMIEVHVDLPDSLKLVFALCKHEGTPVAVLGWFPEGRAGLPLVAATGNRGLEMSASYPLFWRMVEYYKKHGFTSCDLGGVSLERNRGGYLFKAGLAGRECEPEEYIGQFEACENIVSLIGYRAGLFLRSFYRNTRRKLNKLSNSFLGRFRIRTK